MVGEISESYKTITVLHQLYIFVTMCFLSELAELLSDIYALKGEMYALLGDVIKDSSRTHQLFIRSHRDSSRNLCV